MPEDRIIPVLGASAGEAVGTAPRAAPLDDICKIHQTPMIRHQEHVGAGETKWSEPYCPLCQEIDKEPGRLDQVRQAVAVEEAKKASQQPSSPVAKA